MVEKTQLDRIESLVIETRGDVKALHNALYVGDGPDKPSAMTRIDRLEQTESHRKVWIGAAISAAVVSAMTALWSLLTGK